VQLHTCADLDHVNAAHAAKLNKLQELFRQLHNWYERRDCLTIDTFYNITL